MKWAGEKIKLLAKDQGISLTHLSSVIGVTRKAVNDWINGQIPKGNHLMALTKALNINPNELFIEHAPDITLPLHRTRRNAKITVQRSQEALNLAKDYYAFFLNAKSSPVVPVIRENQRNDENARRVAQILRKMTDVQENLPVKHEQVFALINTLGIKLIITKFPESLKVYAFYTKILDHRVVFVNYDTNLLDLNFALLHEAVHAVRDEVFRGKLYDEEEENFCDLVANYIQFPEDYVRFVADNIDSLPTSHAINTLKSFSREYEHALHGIVKQISLHHPKSEKYDVGGADTNLKRGVNSIGKEIFSTDDSFDYVSNMRKISPLFIEALTKQASTLTHRRIGELLGIESSLDAADVKNELLKLHTDL